MEEDMNTCLKCGHTWKPRNSYSMRCPKCKVYTWDGKPRSSKGGSKACVVEGCRGFLYAKDLCQKHYQDKRRITKHKNCKEYQDCGLQTTKEYCHKHLRRIKEGKSLDLSIKYDIKGENNMHWRGGISEYKDHYIFKKNRLKVLEASNYKCYDCGEVAKIVHHMDNTKTNHVVENLRALCQSCHVGNYHEGKAGRPRIFGKYSLQEMADKIGCSITTILIQARNKTISKKYGNQIEQMLKESGYERV